MADPIRIDVWSDVACPWCYIGKRNLEAGLAAAAEGPDAPEVEVVYHSYELSPDMPADVEGTELELLVARKGMPEEQVRQMFDHVTEVAAQAGLAYDFDRVLPANTVKAHELIHYAATQGLQAEMKERLLAAHFTEGRHVGKIDELVALAAEVGLDAAAAREALETDRFLPYVRADQKQAAAYGIQGVPFFVIDGQYGVSGAQPAAAFTQIVRQLWGERTPA
ncbi:DsbA family protein [Microbacterium sp. SORGH_AS_0888]|uniref:DsbA family oxidoreductase n=1 Tax=Microbacterium sp. SORGH_AS_0888 TaxID=3041791 RepID=UPI002784859D|nr:DsbA family oxidoreductase [Microbacterium sp. SORGH_AS_0888]MDQ1128637.1 putative DsbA family dithiol-disulfide isomerase [Microbacterium sp. SORGH_AS_0888]